MKCSTLALAGALTGLLSAGTAYAQTTLGHRSPVQQTALEYNNYYAQDEPASPSDAAPAAAAAPSCAAAPVSDAGCGCNSGCATCASDFCGGCKGGCGGCGRCCDLGETCRLFDCECLKCKGIKVEGYLAQSYTWNTSNPADRFNGPVTWTDRSNEYQLNQAYLYAEKATDTGGCGWDYGWRADVLGGTDYRFTTASGLETRGYFTDPTISTQRFYGLAFPQFYGEVAYNDLKVKVGHFYAPVGYEVVMTNANFFPSLPYTFQYGEPFTFTGITGTYAISDKVSALAGITRGWDNFDNSNPHVGFIGGYTEKFDDESSLALAWTAGEELTTVGTYRPRFLQTLAYSRPLKNISDKLNYVIQSDYGWQNDALPTGEDAHWYGINQYLFYKVDDCLSYGVRAEWFRDEDGTRVGGFLGTVPSGGTRGLSGGRFGYAGSFYEVTFGANYKFSANTMIRPYVRFDWFSGDLVPGLNTEGDPFDDGTGNSQTLIGADLITLF